MGAVGALAPTVFLPRLEIIHTSAPLYLPRPEVVFIRALGILLYELYIKM